MTARTPSRIRVPALRASDIPDFTPVPRKNTVSSGWTPEKQKEFIRLLAVTGSVRLAAEGVGMSYTGVYELRHAPGGASFARAWDLAIRIGAKRVRDVLIDQAIHGIPETVVMGGQRIERRRFNHRTMQWTLQHHLPDEYPGGSTLARKDAGGTGDRITPEMIEEARATIERRVRGIKLRRLRMMAGDPEKRAAYDLLHPGEVDWDTLIPRTEPRTAD